MFILPLTDGNWTNTVDRAQTSNHIYDNQGRLVISVSQASAADAQQNPSLLSGQHYLYYYTFDGDGNATTSIHLVTGHVHTHPSGPDQNNPSQLDRDFYNHPDWQGFPKYILNANNLVEYDDSQPGVKNIQVNNCP